MAEIISFISAYQGWILFGLGVAALIYLRLVYKGSEQYRGARFSLEQDQARSALRRSGAMLILVLAGAVGIFITANFLGPSLPFSARPTVLPTVSLLATQSPSAEGSQEFVAASALPQTTPDGAGCTNPNATISSPENGATLTGVVEVEGTADIPNFAFYKFEFRTVGQPDGVWQAISAGTDPVNEGVLGNWDTSLVPASDYDFRLVVTDTAGNAPLPCTIQVRVVPSEQ